MQIALLPILYDEEIYFVHHPVDLDGKIYPEPLPTFPLMLVGVNKIHWEMDDKSVQNKIFMFYNVHFLTNLYYKCNAKLVTLPLDKSSVFYSELDPNKQYFLFKNLNDGLKANKYIESLQEINFSTP